MTDMYVEPPVNDGVDDLRALVMAHLARLPVGGIVPEQHSLDEDERDALLS